MKLSSMFTLNLKDVAKGIALAVISAVVTAAYQQLTIGGAIDFHAMVLVGEIAGLSYLVKNFFSTSDGKVAGVIG